MSPAPSRIRRPEQRDLVAVVDLLNACDVAETGAPDTTLQDLENDWMLEGFDPTADAWLAESADGRIVGYAYTGDQLRTGELEADYWTHPENAEPGLAERLLTLTERRARDLALTRAYQDARLDVFCIRLNQPKRELLRGRGFSLVRTVYRMAAELTSPPDPGAPPGIDIRPFRLPEDAPVMHATMREAFTDQYWRSNEPFEAWKARLLGHDDFDPGLWFMAWAAEEAVGGVVAYDHGDLGWIKGLGVRRQWRRRGIGGALLATAFAELFKRGQRRIELGVDVEGVTQPLRVYEHAGMHSTFAYECYSKALTASDRSPA